MDEVEEYRKESSDILAMGLANAPYIRVDDTGEKHTHRNSYCTHIGGEFFAYFKTSFSKSRHNFLSLLPQGKEGYIFNTAFIWHLFQCGVEDDILNLFEMHKGKHYKRKSYAKHAMKQGLWVLSTSGIFSICCFSLVHASKRSSNDFFIGSLLAMLKLPIFYSELTSCKPKLLITPIILVHRL